MGTQQNRIRVGSRGSFIIAAICQDGILIVSESRANIYDKSDQNQKPIAYYDSCQKIFPFDTVAMAETGHGLILNVFFSEIRNDFSRALVRQPPTQELLPEFMRYCHRIYPPQAFAQLQEQKLFAAGFSGEHPVICYFNKDQEPGPFACIQDNGFIQSAPTLFSNYQKSLTSMSCEEAAKVASNAIEEYASVGDRWKTIGGPHDALHVSKDSCRWIKKSTPVFHWKTIQEFARDYWKGIAKLTLIPPATKADLEELISTIR